MNVLYVCARSFIKIKPHWFVRVSARYNCSDAGGIVAKIGLTLVLTVALYLHAMFIYRYFFYLLKLQTRGVNICNGGCECVRSSSFGRKFMSSTSYCM